MVSFLDIPLDLVALISIRAGVPEWLALSRTCWRFSKLSGGIQKKVIMAGLTVRNVNSRGTQIWTLAGNSHRDNDLPASIWSDGTKEWYQHGDFIE